MRRLAVQISDRAKRPIDKKDEINFAKVLSTGSTLLDLAISGGQCHQGGIPGGILVEIFGPSGFGKTTIMAEIGANAQAKGGFFLCGDAERRLTREYAELMGIKLTDENYEIPRSVKDVEEMILSAPETEGSSLDVVGIDSIAALTSQLDESKEGDKRGSARAKELHQLCRKAKGEISKKSRLVVFTNQIQDVQDVGGYGPKEKTPGGHAVPFYSSLRIRVGPGGLGYKLKKTAKMGKTETEKIIGIRSTCYVFKSSIDDPYRSADIFIIYGYGIDDIRGNLEWLKGMSSENKYDCLTAEWKTIDRAIRHIEENDLQDELRMKVIEFWRELENKFKTNRKPKVRF